MHRGWSRWISISRHCARRASLGTQPHGGAPYPNSLEIIFAQGIYLRIRKAPVLAQ
jgi:hypothetical protein